MTLSGERLPHMNCTARLLRCITIVILAACGGEPAESDRPTVAMHRIDTITSGNAAAIVYEVYGDSAGKPAVVLVHCWSCDRGYWYAQVEELAEDFKVVAIDLAGHGDSDAGSRTDFTMTSFGGDVAAVVGDLGLERVVLVGHSMGGGVIVEAAQQLPGKVRGLVWVDSYHGFGKPSTAAELAAFFAPFDSNFVEQTRGFVRSMFPPTADSTLAARIAMDMSSAPPAVAMSAIRNAFGYEDRVPAALAALKLPVVAINAGLFPTDTMSLQQHGVQVTIMTGVGHFLPMEDPARFNVMLRGALDRMPQ